MRRKNKRIRNGVTNRIMYEIRLQKDKLRADYLEKRKKTPAELRRLYDEKICERFMALVTYRYADIILMYAPFGYEINVDPIAVRALAAGKTVAYPKCDKTINIMKYHIVSSTSQLVKGKYGIMEPPDDLPVFSHDKKNIHKTVCLVPALVYDVNGFRIGYGKGYYDRYLFGFSGIKVGFSYKDFIVPSVPRGRYDLAVDVLVTEKGVSALHV